MRLSYHVQCDLGMTTDHTLAQYGRKLTDSQGNPEGFASYGEVLSHGG